MFASQSTAGFYDPAINDVMPSDVVEISAEVHAALLAGEGEGRVIAWGPDGYPFLIDPPPPPPEAVAAVERAWRDAQLAATDGVVSRHRDELEEGINTSLTAEQYAELQVYRRLLRNWPEGAEFPLVDHRPVAPPWLASPLQ